MMARNPFGGTFGWAMVATILFLGIAVNPVDGQDDTTCGWSDFAIESFANYVGTYQVPLEDCIAHPIEFKIMIFSGAILCCIFFIIPCILFAYTIASHFQDREDRVEPFVLIMLTVVNPFIE